MTRTVLPLLAIALGTWAPSRLDAADAFPFQDGDRVVWLGNTLIEREQRYGYWEAALTRRYPDKALTFRNLGWSGDTVFGEARAGFGSAVDGFRHLREHVLALKPTVLVVAYGLNESFQGPAGVGRFQNGLNVLLDALAPTRARVVLLAPLRHEDLGRPLPDPSRHNENIRLYAEVLRKTASQRGYRFVDLSDLLGDAAKAGPLTDNGIHLTAYGYWRTTAALEQGLGLKPLPWRIDIDEQGKATAQGVAVTPLQTAPIRFTATDLALPAPPAPPFSPPGASLPGAERLLRVRGLPPGRYALKIDGKPVTAATAVEWATGMKLTQGPAFDQEQRLRAAIVEKNRLYFYRWRPQNETYLFGFRKHEQGKNAQEIPQFDPLVAKVEAQIAELRKPVPHRYELIKEQK